MMKKILHIAILVIVARILTTSFSGDTSVKMMKNAKFSAENYRTTLSLEVLDVKKPNMSVISVVIDGEELVFTDDNLNIDVFYGNEEDDRKLTKNKYDIEQVRRSKLIYVANESDSIVEYGHDPISGLPDFVDDADISDFI